MAVAPPHLATPAEVAAHAEAMRRSGWHIAQVYWQGQRAWLKRPVPPAPAWRYYMLGATSRLLRQPALYPMRVLGGEAGLAVEAERIRALAQAGLAVPQILAAAPGWLLLAHLGSQTLEHRLKATAETESRLALWEAGAGYLVRTHASGQYLSQAFARNFIWLDAGGVAAIDFEDDALAHLTLTQAQTRDWFTYLFSTAIYFQSAPAALEAAVRAAWQHESPALVRALRAAAKRTAWLRAARLLPARMQRTDVRKTRAFGALAHALAR